METKFTKGKWVLVDDIENCNVLDIYNTDKSRVVSTCWVNDENEEEANANAKLIAAAPLLLDALTNILNIMNDSEGVAGYHLNGDIAKWAEFEEIASAEQAIKKATE